MSIKQLFVIIIIFFAITNICLAEEEQNAIINEVNTKNIAVSPDTRISVYIHPWTLFITSMTLFSDNEYYLYATVEVPLNLSTSLIISPSLWDGRIFIKGYELFGDIYKGKRLGSDIGIRCYTEEKGKGFYYQGQIGLFYYKERFYSWGGSWFGGYAGQNAVYMWGDIMGYIGNVWQPSDRVRIHSDFGLGCAIIGSKSYLSIDANFGIGFRIGKKPQRIRIK